MLFSLTWPSPRVVDLPGESRKLNMRHVTAEDISHEYIHPSDTIKQDAAIASTSTTAMQIQYYYQGSRLSCAGSQNTMILQRCRTIGTLCRPLSIPRCPRGHPQTLLTDATHVPAHDQGPTPCLTTKALSILTVSVKANKRATRSGDEHC